MKINRKDLEQILIDNFTDNDGNLDLRGLDFRDFSGDIMLHEMKAKKTIYNMSQNANEILNTFQEADVITNANQEAREIWNNGQSAKDKISNSHQEADKIE